MKKVQRHGVSGVSRWMCAVALAGALVASAPVGPRAAAQEQPNGSAKAAELRIVVQKGKPLRFLHKWKAAGRLVNADGGSRMVSAVVTTAATEFSLEVTGKRDDGYLDATFRFGMITVQGLSPTEPERTFRSDNPLPEDVMVRLLLTDAIAVAHTEYQIVVDARGAVKSVREDAEQAKERFAALGASEAEQLLNQRTLSADSIRQTVARLLAVVPLPQDPVSRGDEWKSSIAAKVIAIGGNVVADQTLTVLKLTAEEVHISGKGTAEYVRKKRAIDVGAVEVTDGSSSCAIQLSRKDGLPIKAGWLTKFTMQGPTERAIGMRQKNVEVVELRRVDSWPSTQE